MADELEITHAGDTADLYAVIRRKSDARVWSTTTTSFEVFADANIANYDTALTARSGDLYQGDFPTAITTPLNATIHYYKRATATPAITDLLLFVSDESWDGTSLTGVSATVSSNALTTLDSVKRYMGTSTVEHDTILTELINQVSERIESITARRFKARDWHFWIYKQPGDPAVLPQYPTIRINKVSTGHAAAIDASYTGAGIQATIQVYRDDTGKNGGTSLFSVDSSGATTVTDLAFSVHGSTSAMAAAINAVADWTATVRMNIPTKNLYTSIGIDAKSKTASLSYPDIDHGVSNVDQAIGLLHEVYGSPGNPQTFGMTLVEARCGYEVIPNDLVLAANEMVAAAFNGRGHNMKLTSQSLGPESYTLANAAEVSDRVGMILAQYTEVR